MLENARCVEGNAEDWFAPLGSSEPGNEGISLTAKRAQRVCETCPVRRQCLEVAMKNETTQRYRWGIWGGLTPNQRHELAKKRRAA